MPKPNSTSQRALELVQTFTDAGFPVSGVTIDGRKISVHFFHEFSEQQLSVQRELDALEGAVDELELARAQRRQKKKRSAR